MRRCKLALCMLLCLALTGPAQAEGRDFIKWVDFDLSCEAMSAALEIDQRSREQEQPLSWIDILALDPAGQRPLWVKGRARRRGRAAAG